MRYIGIDSGLGGALAALDSSGRVLELAATPVLHVDGGREYNVEAIARLMLKLMNGRPGDAFVTIEWQRALPTKFGIKDPLTGERERTGGFKVNWTRGLSLGVWSTVVALVGVPRENRLLVEAQAWQRVQLAGARGADTKERAIAQARRLWPGVSLVLPRGRKESADAADALHIAQYGRMQHKGGALFAALDLPAVRNTDVFRRA